MTTNNPNIASLSELHVGSYTFQLKTNQVIILHAEDKTGEATSITWEHNVASTFAGFTMGKLMLVAGGIVDNVQTLTGMTYDSEAMTRIITGSIASSSGNPYGVTGVFYHNHSSLSDNHGDDNNIVLSVSGSEQISAGSVFLESVDQTTPFIAQDTHQDADWSAGTATANYAMRFMDGKSDGEGKMFAQPGIAKGNVGDLVLDWCFHHETYETMKPNPGQWRLCTQDGSHNDVYDVFTLLAQPVYGQHGGIVHPGKMDDRFVQGHGEPASLSAFRMVVQSDQTQQTIATAPANRSIKINSIRATNAEKQNIYVNIHVVHTSSRQILDSDDNAGSVLTATSPQAGTTLVRSRLIPTSGVELLDRPIYLAPGDVLKADAKSTNHSIWDFQKSVDLHINFESMED